MLVQKMQEKETRWKTSLLLFSIYLCCFIFLTSCDTDKGPGIPEFRPDTSDTTPGDISDKLVTRIYFDATLSMQGFVVPGSTHYTRICPYLESVIVSGWREGEVKFFRFGEQVERITDRNTYLQTGHADFYEQENIYRETFIQKIIDHEDQLTSDQIEASSTPEKPTEMEESNMPEESTERAAPTEEVEDGKEDQLVVIVTDLFQDNSDINLLVTQLKEKYIKNGRAVGLFGLRSQFDGTVYDIGIGEEPLPHKSNPNDPKTFRPFYLLVLGRHTDIAHYFDRLIANGFPEAKTIIFSRYLVSPLLSFDEARIELDNLNKKIINHAHSQDSHLGQYEIVRNSDPAEISAKIAYNPLLHAMFFDSNGFEVSIIATCTNEEETERSREAQEGLKVGSTLLKNEEGKELSVKFGLSNSLQSAIYLYEVALSPNVDKYRAPEWCSEWDMGAGRDGARTLNLVNFVRGLTEITVREHDPEIAKFYFYVKKR